MTKLKTALSLGLGLTVVPQALAHDMPVPHEHGQDLGLLFWAGFGVLLVIGSVIAWKSLTQNDK